MSDLISRSALIEHIKDVPTWLVHDKNPRKYPVGMYDPEDIISSIENAPTIEAEPVRYGEWIEANDGTHFCSECGSDAQYTWDDIDRNFINSANDVPDRISNYCPNCGAKMKGAKT